jgi:hypothetical protein
VDLEVAGAVYPLLDGDRVGGDDRRGHRDLHRLLVAAVEQRAADTATVDGRAEQHGGGVGRRVVGQQRRGTTAPDLSEEHQLVAGRARDAHTVGHPGDF